MVQTQCFRNIICFLLQCRCFSIFVSHRPFVEEAFCFAKKPAYMVLSAHKYEVFLMESPFLHFPHGFITHSGSSISSQKASSKHQMVGNGSKEILRCMQTIEKRKNITQAVSSPLLFAWITKMPGTGWIFHQRSLNLF